MKPLSFQIVLSNSPFIFWFFTRTHSTSLMTSFGRFPSGLGFLFLLGQAHVSRKNKVKKITFSFAQ